jgi:integrase
MLARAVQSYLAVRRAAGYALKAAELSLRSFAADSDRKGRRYVTAKAAIEWARQSPSPNQRARRLGHVRRFAIYLHAEDAGHEIPPEALGKSTGDAQPLTLSPTNRSAGSSNSRQNRGIAHCADKLTVRFSRCWPATGLRVSEAINLKYDDITPDGLIIRATKFRKNRLVPLHPTDRTGLERYLKLRRPYAPFDDHVFICLRRKPLLIRDVETIPNRD